MGVLLGMCEHCGDYTYLDVVTFGGPSGDYEIIAAMQSARWIEYRLVSIANSTFGDTHVVVSTKLPPKAVPFDNTVTLNTDNFLHARVFYLQAGSMESGQDGIWERITNSMHKVFARIDAGGNGATYISVQFRARILTTIPGPFPSTHPDLGHQMNIERADRIEHRLKQLGIPPEKVEEK